MNHYQELENLARFGPQIFGRALSLDGVMGAAVAASGRPDHIDAKTAEIRSALSALGRLQRLANTGPEGLLCAKIIAYSHVVCGVAARGQTDTWVTIGLLAKPRTKALTAHQRQAYASMGLLLYQEARKAWEAI
jgi:hypothetical protein